MSLGYVVIEINQASGMPRIADDDLYEQEEAQAIADRLAEQTRQIGRRERYLVAEVTEEW